MSRADRAWVKWLPPEPGVGYPLKRGGGPIAKDLGDAFAPPDLVAVPDPDSSTAVRMGDGVQLRFDGSLELRNSGETVGTIERLVDTAVGDARHVRWSLLPDYHGAGRARQALISTVALYQRLGIRVVYVDASEVGRYAWASAGFDFFGEGMREEVLESVRPMAARLGYQLDAEILPHNWSQAMLGPEIRGSAAKDAEDASMEPESELNVGPDQRLKLGKALMLSGDCAPWSGALRLDDAQDPTYVRFETYSRDE